MVSTTAQRSIYILIYHFLCASFIILNKITINHLLKQAMAFPTTLSICYISFLNCSRCSLNFLITQQTQQKSSIVAMNCQRSIGVVTVSRFLEHKMTSFVNMQLCYIRHDPPHKPSVKKKSNENSFLNIQFIHI